MIGTHWLPAHWLAATCILTALMWLPYMLEMIVHEGLMAALSNREKAGTPAPWAARIKRAHANAVENLVVFAALFLVAQTLGIKAEAIAAPCAIYFWARLIHFLSYAAGIVVVRTAAFFCGWIATLWVAFVIVTS
jgi:uncharacterized MAPEG superfamily protein